MSVVEDTYNFTNRFRRILKHNHLNPFAFKQRLNLDAGSDEKPLKLTEHVLCSDF